MALNLSKILTGFLKTNPDKNFTAREMAEWAANQHLQEYEQKLSTSKNKNLDEVSSHTERHSVLLNIFIAKIGSQRPSFQQQ